MPVFKAKFVSNLKLRGLQLYAGVCLLEGREAVGTILYRRIYLV